MKVLGFGAILWDKIQNHLNIGGAVFNQMAHLSMLGADADLVTAVGTDTLGDDTLDAMRRNEVGTALVKRVDLPTCVVRVSLSEGGTPSYDVPDKTPWDFIDLDQDDFAYIDDRHFDYFCFGTLEQRNGITRESMHALLDTLTFGQVFLDLNLRLNFHNEEVLRYSLERCDVLKLNEEEAAVLSDVFGMGTEDKALCRQLRDAFDIALICITRGERGAFLTNSEESVFCPGYRVSVADTVGAGDAFSAGLLSKHHCGASLEETGDFANRLGAFVASKQGAVPKYDLGDVDEVLP